MIEFKNVTKEFKDKVVLSDISMEIEDKHLTVLIGPSGCGKTTTLKMINRLIHPTAGDIYIDGENIDELDPVKLRRRMGYVIQQGGLFPHMTIRQNIEIIERLEKRDAGKITENTKRLMKMVDLDPAEYLDRYPSQLSGGQQQRIAIARALATDPKVLLCDEATSALDPTTTSSILNLLKEINKNMGVTIIVITHEMRVIEQICNKVAVIDKSHIVEEGPVREVFTAPKSQIAKQLILPKNQGVPAAEGFRCLRLVFDGTSAFEPIISALSRQCNTDVNILGANTKNIEGVAYGQMLIQLPEDEAKVAGIKEFLDSKKVKYEEEGLNVE